ncbi:hypothetical protein C2845_PM12G21320 [Panicum miliaceum]|uniref:SET domain-containing protein n=1 Tax=Panicum miliaceum TaxID=4540 RepID=A0A3L6QCM2_PANMI|nr:hypothetical protein C2845_PM12G21320 [Panicum miliaceum]
MAFLFNKFQEACVPAVKTLAKNPMFARDPRHLQFEADVNRLFLYTSYYRLGENAEEKDAEEIIDLAGKASVAEQQNQVQENVHYQLTHMCRAMDGILHPDVTNDPSKDPSETHSYSRRSGLSFAVGGAASANKQSAAIPATRPITRAELSNKFRDHFGYTLDIRPSGIPHRCRPRPENNSDRVWRMLSKPLEKNMRENFGEVLERRNPLAFGHFANHPPKGSSPNVMICPYDFPLSEKNMRVYIPNITFGGEEPIKMKRFGSFYFKSGSSDNQAGDSLVLKTLVLVSTRSIRDEELFLNYRYSNSKRRPEWYSPVDEEEDKTRWS